MRLGTHLPSRRAAGLGAWVLLPLLAVAMPNVERTASAAAKAKPARGKPTKGKGKPTKGKAKPTKGKAKARDEEPRGKGPRTLKVRSIDRVGLKILVELTGIKQAPKPNFFVFTDERKRRYIATQTHCDPPLPSGTLVCELDIPPGYERHRLVGVGLHLRSLEGPLLEAPAGQVEAAWAAAASQEPVRRHFHAEAPPAPAQIPDGGAPHPDETEAGEGSAESGEQ